MINLTRIQSSDVGMEEFNRLTASVLSSLYDAFPHMALVNAGDFYEEIDPVALSFMDGTMTFLRDEGFIKIGSEAGEGHLFVGVQLTSKGLAVLDKIPDSLGKGPTIGEKIKTALKSGGKEVLKEAIKTFVSESLKV